MGVEATRPPAQPPKGMPQISVSITVHAGPSDKARSALDAAASGGAKKDKREVEYQPANGTGQDNCERCCHADFTGVGGECSKVAGEVRRGYACRLFSSATLEKGGQP